MLCKEFNLRKETTALDRTATIKTIVMEDGERYATLVDEAGLPLFYPTLYLTTKLRNASKSYSTLVNEAASINVLLQCFNERGVDIHRRIESGNLLKLHEIDALRDCCQQRLLGAQSGIQGKRSLLDSKNYVGLETEYGRLTVIHRYLKFICGVLLPNRFLVEVDNELTAMLDAIVARRPRNKNRNKASVEIRKKDVDLEFLFEAIRPGSEFNPWVGQAVQVRNRLGLLLLYELGIRRGELLSLRCDDFDISSNRVAIVRRADELIDPRASQPLVKTNERLLPVHDKLMREVVNYISKFRNMTPNARQHPYLLVSHKMGRTVGQPLTIAGYKKAMDALRNSSQELSTFTGYKMRHKWNERYSDLMDSMDNPPSEARQEQMRSSAMGWAQGSGTAAIYNKRFVERKAFEAGIKLQEGMFKLPEEFEF
ncbi:tyrosine-type recombinase/integrase [Pseudomonas savastanoi]|nr:tyrosine-type recombinase/integrase [Pseudomonas savastanoi]EFW78384.1 Phage integrase [Pseudomonas savastanoi pv. glycinea str. B076]EFW87884.1 Phage integrase [Pseudomonas savastanoi pv. glycinea str. race 4]EGH13596.1 Phage integrase [Pseudomonas savastanoi pv. glycinea str. race 4]KPC29324.1 Phage integrase [Pseudomonas savastanoi pv. glycinea]KPC34344.1 Phage integrase [Pseudomonas savastanoi pv. glycinea]